jgi:nucleotide-diphospho-sugar transferase
MKTHQSISKDRSIKHLQLSTGVIEKSRALLDTLEAARKRRLVELRLLLEQRNRDNVVLVMMVNYGYIELFRNWAISCDNRGIEVRSWTLVFAVDQEAADCVEQLGFACYLDPTSYGSPCKEAIDVFGDSKFRALMFQKTAIVKDVLDLEYNVLFQDTDVVWFKDPMPYLLGPSNLDYDARFMYDGVNKIHLPLHLNTGFFFLRPRPHVVRFWDDVLTNYGFILALGSQQMVVNQVIEDYVTNGLRIDILPESDFANGHLFNRETTKRLPRDPFVIHCSWTGNPKEKLEKYKFAELWYLDN